MKAKVAERGGGTEINYGEFSSIQRVPNFTIVPVGRSSFVDKEKPDPIDVKMAREGLMLAQEALKNHKCDVLILDEINVAVDYQLLSSADVLDLINMKPETMELVLTGRYAKPEIVQQADLVSEMLEIKHPFQKGVPCRKGIDW
jgi:cob(I)alamin adenosyltransferase